MFLRESRSEEIPVVHTSTTDGVPSSVGEVDGQNLLDSFSLILKKRKTKPGLMLEYGLFGYSARERYFFPTTLSQTQILKWKWVHYESDIFPTTVGLRNYGKRDFYSR